MSRCRPILTPIAAVSMLLVGCADVGPAADDRDRTERTTLRVFAAASLRGSFTELERSFEDAHEDIDIELTFGGSSGLAAQIQQGAPAHVLATADEETMRVVPDVAATRPTVFARNRLAIVVEPGNPKGVTSLRDLARQDLVVVLCAPAVPCGRLAAAALQAEDVVVEARSLEENVGGVRAKVEFGEADAGIVYASDALAAGDALSSVVDARFADDRLAARYPIAVLDGAPRGAATAWVDHIRSANGRAVLERAGFLAP